MLKDIEDISLGQCNCLQSYIFDNGHVYYFYPSRFIYSIFNSTHFLIFTVLSLILYCILINADVVYENFTSVLIVFILS